MFASNRAPIVQDYRDSLPLPLEETSGSVKYIGYTERLGVGETEERWLIIRITTTGGLTKPEYANGEAKFNSKWSDRATLKYSR